MVRNPAAKPLAAGDVDQLILAVLGRAIGPVSASQVHRALPRAGRPPQAAVLARLHGMTPDGTVHAWPGGRSPLFSVRKPEEAILEIVLRALSEGPQSEAMLRKKVPRPTAPLVTGLVTLLVQGGQVFRHPPLGKTKTPLYGLAPADPLRYLAAPLDRAVRDCVKLGFDEGQVRAAIVRYATPAVTEGTDPKGPAPTAAMGDGAIVHEAILQLNPRAREGALVYVPHLRVALGSRFRDKTSFDRTLLGLLATGQIQLQSHPVPSQLNAEEKEAMVPDGRGSYYMAVGLRRP